MKAGWKIAIFAIVALILLAALLLIRQYRRDYSKAQVAEARARADSLGMLVYAEQLQKHAVSDERNAWVDLDELRKLYDTAGTSSGDWKNVPEIMSIRDKGQFLSHARAALGRWEPMLALARKAAKKQGYFPNVNWEDGAALLRPDFATCKAVIRALLMESRTKQLEGDVEAAVQPLEVAAQIARLLLADRTVLGVLVCAAIEVLVAKEVVAQAALAESTKHREALSEVLGYLYRPVQVEEAFAFETVLFVESVRMVSIENEAGNRLRSSIRPEDRPLISRMDLPPHLARLFEARALQEAGDYYAGLNDDLSAYAHNDALLHRLTGSTANWTADGFPIGFAKLLEQLGGGGFVQSGGAYWRLALRSLSKQATRLAFEMATGNIAPSDGQSWIGVEVNGSELTYASKNGGFEIEISAPDVESSTLSFERL